MKQSEIKELSDVDLLAHYGHVQVEAVKMENFSNGITKKHQKELHWTFEEVSKRFNVDKDELINKLGY